jgi:precorrin-6A synthase
VTEAHNIVVIGMGAGNPDYLTVQAIEALNSVDVFFIPDKGTEKAALRQLRETICKRFITRSDYRMVEFDVPPRRLSDADYAPSVDAWRHEVEDRYAGLLAQELKSRQRGGILVWGDPCLYDGSLRVLEGLVARGIAIDYEVIPGITAVQALAARHRIALNGVGEPVLLTTGRRLAAGEADAPNIVVMLDGSDAHTAAADDLEIFWGAYVGMPQEVLVAGRLGDVKDEITRRRGEGRDANGWIMDTYLLRRPGKAEE